jgi:hypothetical protein
MYDTFRKAANEITIKIFLEFYGMKKKNELAVTLNELIKKDRSGIGPDAAHGPLVGPHLVPYENFYTAKQEFRDVLKIYFTAVHRQ